MARSKTALALLLLTGVMTLTVPLAAQEDEEYDLPSVMAEFWASETGQELIAEYSADPATSGTSDPTGDFEHSSGEEPGLTPSGNLDIVETRIVRLDFDTWDTPPDTPPFFDTEANGGVFCETDPLDPAIPGVRTFCPPDGFDAAVFSDGAQVSVIETAEPFGLFNLSQSCEWVMWLRNPTIEETFTALPDFPLDPADGTNQAVGLRIGPNASGPFRLDLGPDGFFQQMPTNTLVAIGENQIAFFVPQTEMAPPDGARGYTFCTEGSFQASDSVADSTERHEVQTELVRLVLSSPPEPTTTTTAPTTTTTEATTTTASTDTTLVEAADEANLESGSFSRFIPLIVIAGIVVVGITLYWRTRERGTGGGDASPGGGRGQDGEAGLTPPVAGVVDGSAHGRCDWALYFLDDGVRKLLREPDGHECCVYEVEVSTSIDFHDEAMRGRQDAESNHVEGASADERLRIPDLALGQAGNGIWGWASARSGPAGRLDWMQGLGDPRANAGRDADHSEKMQLTQHRTLEEGPEVAAHLTHLETTSVKATLEPGCPDHQNSYKLNGTSQALVHSTYECTNSAPGPECPVEITAAAWVAGGLAGDLNYWASEISTSDVDEIEPLAERLRQRMEVEGPVAMTDSHDHATRPRDTYESTRTGNGANTLSTDTTTFSLLSGLRFESGTIVPVATWPNTERVTADVYGDVGHDVTVDASMAKGDCSGGCCDVGECRCAPEFTLAVGANSGRLTVDGKTFDITRPTPEGDWRLA